MVSKLKVAVIGPGNIGTDLMYKILRSPRLQMEVMAGVEESEGIRRARSLGVRTTIGDLRPILDDPGISIVFDATSAKAHVRNARTLAAAGKIAIDLTPAAVGPQVVPSVNLDQVQDAPNLNMVTCGGQATVPIVHAIHRAAGARYAEMVSAIASKSAGPGTRHNIDEFTQTTARALMTLGGAAKGKAIIVLNPAEPPLIMTNTVYVEVDRPDETAIARAVDGVVAAVREYVPGYRLRVPPIVDGHKVTTIIEVEGAGDFLPKYSGNLDIITAAAVGVAERLATRRAAREVA
jgi:acetaldehyde dehydrogenase (acetylating)